jgi:hypothetical protein
MTKKKSILRLALLPFGLIVWSVGWCLMFLNPTDKHKLTKQ